MVDLVKALNQFSFIETKYSCYGGHGSGLIPYVVFETNNEEKLIKFIYDIMQIQTTALYWYFIRWFRTAGYGVMDNYKLHLIDVAVDRKDMHITRLLESIEKVKDKYLSGD